MPQNEVSMKRITILLILSWLGLLSGCATTPRFDTAGVNDQLTPLQASQSAKQAIGQTVIWGGLILSIRNLPDYTQLEVLAYPLDSDSRPQTSGEPGGRFLVKRQGYLESAEYAPGRYVSVKGRITGMQKGKISETEYLYPQVDAEQIFLWSKNFEAEKPTIHFGIGVMFGG